MSYERIQCTQFMHRKCPNREDQSMLLDEGFRVVSGRESSGKLVMLCTGNIVLFLS